MRRAFVAAFLVASACLATVGISPAVAQTQRVTPQSKGEALLSFSPVVKQAQPAVVNVYASRTDVRPRNPLFDDPIFERFFGRRGEQPGGPTAQSLGSGVIVEAAGFVVTNNHVIDGMTDVKVALADKREFEADIVLRDPRTDLAVLKIKNGGAAFPTLELGDSDAAYSLGILYKSGKGVEKNATKAAEWIGRAASDNNLAAIVELAIMQFNGEGVEKDETAAGKLFLKAAGRNNPIAQNRVARILVAGRGLKRDPVEAMKWHLLARSAGLQDHWLDDELARLTPQEKVAVEEAVRKYVGR